MYTTPCGVVTLIGVHNSYSTHKTDSQFSLSFYSEILLLEHELSPHCECNSNYSMLKQTINLIELVEKCNDHKRYTYWVQGYLF